LEAKLWQITVDTAEPLKKAGKMDEYNKILEDEKIDQIGYKA
jgi:hypothetical protein